MVPQALQVQLEPLVQLEILVHRVQMGIQDRPVLQDFRDLLELVELLERLDYQDLLDL